MKLPEFMRSDRKIFFYVSGILVILLIGVLDVITGSEIAFAIFYLVPVGSFAYYGSMFSGIVASIVSALVWYFADLVSGIVYSHPLIAYWNAFSGFCFFVFISLILSRLHQAFAHEKLLARTDHLTGTANSRSFSETLGEIISLSKRYHHPFTLVYMDIDNFKQINDTMGHDVGDTVLCMVANTMQATIRVSDTVARLGGDEFAILLSETGFEAADKVLAKLQDNLTAVVQKSNWPISFSIGAITYARISPSVDEAIRQTDALMYTIKNSSKNGISHRLADNAPETAVII